MDEEQRCADCGDTGARNESPNGIVCDRCFENYTTCEDCRNVCHLDNSYTTPSGRICSDCYDNGYECCENCAVACRELSENNLCENCENRPRLREVNLTNTKYQSEKSGKTIKSLRSFGVELELDAGNRKNATKICRELPKEFGVGRDGSVRGSSPMEIRTPILRGAAGEQAIKNACRVLKIGSVNHTCGLHIHLETTEIKNDFWKEKSLMLFYLIFDEVIMAMLPSYRRNNHYAKGLKNDFSIGDLLKLEKREQLEQYWYKRAQVDKCKAEEKHNSRYYGINFHCLMSERYQTLEIRYHQPTLNAAKILNWIALHQAIMDQARILDNLGRFTRLLFLDDKINAFFSLLPLPVKLENYYRQRIIRFANKKILCAA